MAQMGTSNVIKTTVNPYFHRLETIGESDDKHNELGAKEQEPLVLCVKV